MGTRASETLTGTSAGAHESLSLLGDRGKTSTLNLPLVGLLRALGSGAVLPDVARAGGVVSLLVGGLEAAEVIVGSDLAVAADLDNSVTVGLDGVLVSETSRVDTGHVGRVEGSNLTPLAGVGDASKLGEEEGLAVVFVRLDLLVPAGSSEGRGVTPGVVVEGEEVGALILGTAVEVESLGLDVLGNVGSRVSNGNLASLAVRDVLLHVTGDGLDVRSSVGVVTLVDDLVTGEEEEQVVVVGKSVDGGKDVLEVDVVVRSVEGLSILTVERVLGGVGVKGNIDTGVVEHLHALVVVLGVVDGVDTDGVDTEILEVGDIAPQALEVEERVLCISSTTCGVVRKSPPRPNVTELRTWLVSNTTHVETLVVCEEAIALHRDWGKLSLALGECGSNGRADDGKDGEGLHDCDCKKKEAIKRLIEESKWVSNE